MGQTTTMPKSYYIPTRVYDDSFAQLHYKWDNEFRESLQQNSMYEDVALTLILTIIAISIFAILKPLTNA